MRVSRRIIIGGLAVLATTGLFSGTGLGSDAVAQKGGDDPPLALNLEFVRVPGGCFQMGSATGEKHERPVHKACVSAFDLGKYEITQGQWNAVMGQNPSYHSACGDRCPVEMVSWNDAQQFIAKLNAGKQGTFRLPTEAEWEYACRDGGKDQVYAGTVTAAELDRIAWFKAHGPKLSHLVGGKQPNALGLYDMSGNVWEWVQDTFASPYRTDLAALDPLQNVAGDHRVLRGGSFDGRENYVRCAIRNRNDADRRDRRLGLRLVREVTK